MDDGDCEGGDEGIEAQAAEAAPGVARPDHAIVVGVPEGHVLQEQFSMGAWVDPWVHG